jgi:outer membrane protein
MPASRVARPLSSTLCAVAAVACLVPLTFANPQADQSKQTTAMPDRTFTGMIIVGAISIPEFEGSADMTALPLIAGELRWGNNRYVALEGNGGRINLVDHERFEFGPAMSITFGRDNEIESLKVRRLGEIDDAFDAGLFAAYNTPSPLRDGDMIRLSAQIMGDTSDVHEGSWGDISASYRARVSDRLGVTLSTTVSYADDDYASTYFSVTPAGAARSGLRATIVEGGLKDVSLGLTAMYELTDRWSLFGIAEYSRLVGDFADSPVVAVEGDKNQLTLGVGFGWKF